MDTFSLVTSVFAIIGGCVALDWHCRGLSQKRMQRRSMDTSRTKH